MNQLKIGIIGLGHIGTAHANRIFSGKIEGMTLCAVCDIEPNRIAYANEKLPGVATFERWQELVESGTCDAVIISTPHRLHTEISAFALKAGLHVLSEKPQDISVTRAASMNSLAGKSDKLYAIMFNQRTDPLFIRLREMVKGGELGEIKSFSWIITNWYRTQYYYDEGSWRATWSGEGGGVLLNQAVHNLDIWQWIFGMPSEITAFCDVARYHSIEVEDSATIFARYPNGATGTFITSTGECPGTNRLEAAGTRGKVVIENGVLKWWRLLEDERDICQNVKIPGPQPETEYSEYKPENGGTAHAGVLQAFADAILKGTEPIAYGEEGINELMISNAAYLSQWLGNQPVKLPIDGELFDRLLAERQKSSSEKNVEDKEIKGEYSSRWSVKW